MIYCSFNIYAIIFHSSKIGKTLNKCAINSILVHTHPPLFFTSPWRPCHPGARLPPGRRASGTPSLTTAFPGCVSGTFSPGSRVMRSRTPACLAAAGLRDDRVAGWKRKEGCGCECGRKPGHIIPGRSIRNRSWPRTNQTTLVLIQPPVFHFLLH